jgi:uncharacterized protein HemX
MVKISMVQHNDQLYQATLLDAQQWVKKNFSQNKDADNFFKTLEKLGEIKIHSQFPDIGSSLKMLRDITKLRIETDKALQKTPSSAVSKHIKSPDQVQSETPKQSKEK